MGFLLFSDAADPIHMFGFSPRVKEPLQDVHNTQKTKLVRDPWKELMNILTSEVHSSNYNMLVLSLWTASAVDFKAENNLTHSSVCKKTAKIVLTQDIPEGLWL